MRRETERLLTSFQEQLLKTKFSKHEKNKTNLRTHVYDDHGHCDDGMFY
ncbi:hypothetical protein SAMN04488028_103128 [Reichenbachiella agariperforans]|uniref:Uncharacterized protein n=1 Tax=Reichenbachiella agariperforans TaxID=156994 RepID=A0A1M6Q125_REIAG|nr:hypothetical protein SAMN04488028_103128 [Reichenbachiella agariperforans]